jgi:hypothetical protein
VEDPAVVAAAVVVVSAVDAVTGVDVEAAEDVEDAVTEEVCESYGMCLSVLSNSFVSAALIAHMLKYGMYQDLEAGVVDVEAAEAVEDAVEGLLPHWWAQERR